MVDEKLVDEQLNKAEGGLRADSDNFNCTDYCRAMSKEEVEAHLGGPVSMYHEVNNKRYVARYNNKPEETYDVILIDAYEAGMIFTKRVYKVKDNKTGSIAYWYADNWALYDYVF